ncbi:secretion system protein E [Candidatus Pacearchaeota archaeon]|nr:secretion system protein E [Candidatus Pacearchaeota archaeon]
MAHKIESFPKVQIDFTPKLPRIQKIKDKTKVNLRYSLISPFTFAHIYWDDKNFELAYEVEEPILNDQEKKYKKEIISAMGEAINFEQIVDNKRNTLLDYLDKMFRVLAIELDMDMTYESYQKIFYYLARDFMGFNEVDPLLRDYFVEDIECNGVNSPIYIVHRMYRNMKTNIIFKNPSKLESFVEKLAQRSGKYISYSQPILDASLPDGSRVNATYTKDITSRGPTFTIRKFTKTPWTPPQLLNFKTLSPEMMAYLWMLIENHMNILIAGGTASGKTTLLNAIAFFISPESRVVSIEDTRELNLPRENWLPSVVRTATGVKGEGEVDLFALLRSSFRQNPDYVIVGEVRGKEAYVLFQGMASGHSSLGTIHAESVDTVIKRLESPPIELSPTLLNVLDCVCVMSHASVEGEDTRKLREIVEIINVKDNGIALTNRPFYWNASNDNFYFKDTNKIFEKISTREGIPLNELNMEFSRRSQLLRKLQEQGTFQFEKVQNIINEYYKKPKEVLSRYNIR